MSALNGLFRRGGNGRDGIAERREPGANIRRDDGFVLDQEDDRGLPSQSGVLTGYALQRLHIGSFVTAISGHDARERATTPGTRAVLPTVVFESIGKLTRSSSCSWSARGSRLTMLRW